VLRCKKSSSNILVGCVCPGVVRVRKKLNPPLVFTSSVFTFSFPGYQRSLSITHIQSHPPADAKATISTHAATIGEVGILGTFFKKPTPLPISASSFSFPRPLSPFHSDCHHHQPFTPPPCPTQPCPPRRSQLPRVLPARGSWVEGITPRRVYTDC
jgi:hypothetical protein